MRVAIDRANVVAVRAQQGRQTRPQRAVDRGAEPVFSFRRGQLAIALSLAGSLIGSTALAQTVTGPNPDTKGPGRVAKRTSHKKAEMPRKTSDQFQRTMDLAQKKPSPFAKFDNLREKGMELNIPGPADTVTKDLGGVRSALADVGIGYVAWTQDTFINNLLPNAAQSTIAKQLYSGQNPTFSTSNYLMVTYDLSRYGITDGQIIAGTERQYANWNPLLPDRWGINEIAYYQTFFDKRLELKTGYLRNSNEFGISLASVNAGASVFGPSANILYQGGMSSNQSPTPALNLKFNIDGAWYNKLSIQRAISPDGVAAYIAENPTGLNWSTPNAGLLLLDEVGYDNKAAPGVPKTVFRAGAGFNNSNYANLEYPKQPRADENRFYYVIADRQLLQTNVQSSASRGIYGGFSAMYAPPELNKVSQYYELRLFAKGLFDSRPDDQISLIATDTIWSNFSVDAAAAAGNLVHRDSKAISGTYSAHLAPGIYTSLGISYINHPTAITYTSKTGHALNFSLATSVFF